ncbi:MAG: hypothetical protein PHW12_00300, partial [Smithella sp.]|nr:hypothetical protein [Smithella sp.]
MKNILASLVVGLGSIILFPQMASPDWTSVTTSFDWSSMNAFAVSGTNLFVGVNGQGAFVSTDNGVTWSATGLTGVNVQAFAVNGADLYAGTQNGIYHSSNNGINWNTVSNGNGFPQYTTVLSLAVSGSNLLAGTYYNGLYLSTNNGTSWNLVNNGFPTGAAVSSI